jgi:UDP:flavonoid glycosyltransferase YjiC (YdhE family)
LGIASNLDQYLATQAIVRAGAGLMIRAGTATRDDVRAALARLFGEPSFTTAARAAAAALRAHDAATTFRAFVDEATGVSGGVPNAAAVRHG